MPKFEVVPRDQAELKTATGLILEYARMIESVAAGQAGRLIPGEDETTQAIRRRLGKAAKAMGVDLTIKRKGDTVYFWKEKRKRGRPRKVTLEG